MYLGNNEPTVAELLSDPIARLMLARDGVHADMVWDCLHDAKRRLRTVPAIDPVCRRAARRAIADRRCMIVLGMAS